jgi:hypothetical protein
MFISICRYLLASSLQLRQPTEAQGDSQRLRAHLPLDETYPESEKRSLAGVSGGGFIVLKTEIHLNNILILVRTSHKTHWVSITKIDWLTLFIEAIYVYLGIMRKV